MATDIGLATTPAEDYRPHRLAITPTISQATPDSFLPRWGKKPFLLAFPVARQLTIGNVLSFG